MSKGKRITELSDVSGREPYQTILNILLLLDKPLSVPHILAILNPSDKKTKLLRYEFEKSLRYMPLVCRPDIKQFEHIRRGRIYEVLTSLVELGLVLKNPYRSEVKYTLNPDFKGKIYLNCVIPTYQIEFFESRVEFSKSLAAVIEVIEQIKSQPDYININEALTKYPDKLLPEEVENLNKQVEKECLLSLWKDRPDYTAGFILANLKKDFRTNFDNALDTFGLKEIQNDFDIRLEVKFRKKVLYEGNF